MNPSGGDIEVTTCPECGTPITERGVPRPGGWTSWRYVAPLVSVAVMLVGLGVIFWSGRAAFPVTASRGVVRPSEFVRPYFTIAELRRIAEGKTETNGSLSCAIMELGNPWLVRPPGEEYLRIQFRPGDGTRRDSWTYGWPVPLVYVSGWGEYLDIAKEAEIPADQQHRAIAVTGRLTKPRTEMVWEGGQVRVLRSKPTTSFFRDYLLIDLMGMVGVLMFPVVAWYCVAGVFMVLWRRRGSDARRRAARFAGWAAAGVVALALGCVAVFFPSARVSATPGSYSLWVGQSVGNARGMPTFDDVVTDVTYKQIESMLLVKDGDRRLASKLLGYDIGAYEGWYLCAAFSEDSTRGGEETRYDWPWQLLRVDLAKRWYVGPPSDGRASGGRIAPFKFSSPAAPAASPAPAERITWPASGAIVRTVNGELQLVLPRSAPSQELRMVMISLSGVLFCCFLLWFTWVAARVACLRRAAMIGRRRVAAQQCVSCGYSLAGVAEEVR